MKIPEGVVAAITLSPCVDNVLSVEHLVLGDRNQILRIERDAGGKGINLARVLHKLGVDTLATGFVGGPNGCLIKAVLDGEGVPHDFVHIRSESRTNYFIESEVGPPTGLSGISPIVRDDEVEVLMSSLKVVFECADWVTFGGAIPSGMETDTYYKLVRLAQEYGCRVVLDADGECLDLALKAAPDFIKPNVREAERLLARTIASEADAFDAAEDLLDLLKEMGGERVGYSPVVVLSRGSEGAVMCCSKGRFSGVAPVVKMRSTIGSGDSMIAAMIFAIQQKKEPEEWLKWGLAAGAATAATNGSEIGSRSMILQFLEQAGVRQVPSEVAPR